MQPRSDVEAVGNYVPRAERAPAIPLLFHANLTMLGEVLSNPTPRNRNEDFASLRRSKSFNEVFRNSNHLCLPHAGGNDHPRASAIRLVE
jgi:hypothetical protein